MNEQTQQHSSSWVAFSYLSFLMAAVFVFGGIWFIPTTMWVKAYLMMGCVMLVQSAINVTKTLRDQHESGRLINRIEEAKTERLIRDVARPDSEI